MFDISVETLRVTMHLYSLKNQSFRLLRPACEVDFLSKPSDDYTVTVDTAAYES